MSKSSFISFTKKQGIQCATWFLLVFKKKKNVITQYFCTLFKIIQQFKYNYFSLMTNYLIYIPMQISIVLLRIYF